MLCKKFNKILCCAYVNCTSAELIAENLRNNCIIGFLFRARECQKQIRLN